MTPVEPLKLRFGVVVGPIGPSRNIAGIARAAEGAGFELLGLGDNQSLWRDVYVTLAVAAQSTSRIRLGPCVTNLVTRHLTVTVGAVATIDELSDGRAFLGLGSGDSAVLNIGRRPAPLVEVEAGVTTAHRLLADRPAWDGERPIHLDWASRRFPIFVSAEGPKGLAMAGRVADGAFVTFGLGPDEVEGAERLIAEASVAAGRPPGAVEVWHAARVSVADDEREALAAARTAMASVAHHALRHDPATRGVPSELVPALGELNAGYWPAEHARAGSTHNEELVENLGLLPYLAGRFAIAGTPRRCAERLVELERSGVRRLLLMFAGTDLEAQLERWARDVLPLAAGAR
jgi:5,10-methylenetetrahydromethanopterin reductase